MFRIDFIKLLTFILGVLMIIMTVAFPVNGSINILAVYTRNIVSAATWFSLSYFFSKWSDIKFGHSNSTSKTKKMKKLAIASIIAIIVCTAKVLISALNILLYLDNDILFIIYYVGETVAWAALDLFFIYYYKKTIKTINKRNSKD